MVTVLNDLRWPAKGATLYERLVVAWEFITEENDREIHLVTEDEKREWGHHRRYVDNLLTKAGEGFLKTGTWDEKTLASVKSFLLNNQERKTEEQLIKRAEKAVPKSVEVQVVSGLLGRLKRFAGRS